MSAFRGTDVVEEMRLLGNTVFKAGQYRRAEQVYKNGLALMDLSLDNVCITGPPFCGHINSTRAALALSTRDNLTAATLLVNLAQALLSGSTSPDAAREAFYIISWAESHLVAVKFMNSTKRTRASEKEVEQQYTTLREKAFTRKGMASERCADPANALAAYLRCKGSIAMERRADLMEVLQSYHNKKDGDMLVVDGHNKFWLPHSYWKYSATLSLRGIPFANPGTGGHDLGLMKAAYSCGVFQDVQTLVVTRFKCRGSDVDTDLHFFCRLMPDGAMSSWSPLGADTGSMCDTGAVLNEKLYCISLCNDPYVKVWNMNSTGGHDKPLRIPILETPIGHDVHLRRLFADLVGCCGDLYMFGGLAFGPDTDTPEANGDLLRFSHNHDQFVECSVHSQPDVREEDSYPPARFGHATFVHGHYIYIFGGTEGREPSIQKDVFPGTVIASYMDDLWCFNVRTKEWRQLEPLGVRPSPRAFMGVGCNGKRTVIMGGEALREGFHSAFNLADVWEFDPEACAWTPVVEGPNQNRCLTSRKCPGVAMISNGDVSVFGGHSSPLTNRHAGAVDSVHLSINRLNVNKVDSFRRRMRPPKGAWRDAATEEMCRIRMQSHSEMSEKERLMMRAPAGSVVVLTPRPAELAPCALTPADAANPSFTHLLPFPYKFHPGPISPLRPIEGDGRYLFGRGGIPFYAAPRWMTQPSEVTTKLLASPRDFTLLDRHGSCLSVWHSVKHFSTVKAAALFFRMHQPNIGWEQSSVGWCRVKGLPLYKDTQRLLAWDVRELSVFYTTRGKQGQNKSVLMAEYYILVVFGRVFVCMLADVPVMPALLPRLGGLHAEVAESLIRMQHELLSQPSVNLRPACQYCGASDPPPSTVEDCPSLITKKVCKGCRLVRYCGRKCQQADWQKHQSVCAKVAAGQENDLWVAEHSL